MYSHFSVITDVFTFFCDNRCIPHSSVNFDVIPVEWESSRETLLTYSKVRLNPLSAVFLISYANEIIGSQ